MESLELQEQQHLEMQELIQQNQARVEKLLGDIILVLSVEKNNDNLIEAITENIDKFVKQIREIRLPPAEVNIEPTTVNLNQDKVVLSLENTRDKIVEKLGDLSKIKQPEKWNFIFIRDSEGVIISATANQIK